MNLYYSPEHGCLKGIKPTYGWDAKNANLIGSSHNSYKPNEVDIKLATGEFINKVDIASGV